MILLHLSQIELRRLRIKDNFASSESVTMTQSKASRQTFACHQHLYRRQQLCSQFAYKCTASEKYSGWFPLNNHTHGTSLYHTRTYKVSKSRILRCGNSAIPHLTFPVFLSNLRGVGRKSWCLIGKCCCILCFHVCNISLCIFFTV